MPAYSVLDLVPIAQGHSTADALAQTARLAQHAEGLGYARYWLAEHHNMPGVASSATAVLIGHVAAQTKTIRVGAGGIMLPNHAPLVVAEQFGTLATLYPGRIDLGLGRAPGTDMTTARALRRSKDLGDHFPDDVTELIGFLQPAVPGQPVRAIPGEGTQVPVWILGSSLYGADLAARFGLPYAFASHFAPDAVDQALAVYRDRFQPGLTDRPHVMMAMNVVAADDSGTAQRLFTSVQQAFLNLGAGRPSPLPRPVEDFGVLANAQQAAMVNRALRFSAVGDAGQIHGQITAMMDEYAPDEVIISGPIHDPLARLRSFEIAAQVMQEVNGTRPAPRLQVVSPG